jgi:hypothetical protein
MRGTAGKNKSGGKTLVRFVCSKIPCLVPRQENWLQQFKGMVLVCFLLAAVLGCAAGTPFALSNTLGDHMVLQRDALSPPTIVWGVGNTDQTVYTTFLGKRLTTTVGSDGIWRQALPSTPAGGPYTIAFHTDEGDTAQLQDVLFGGEKMFFSYPSKPRFLEIGTSREK